MPDYIVKCTRCDQKFVLSTHRELEEEEKAPLIVSKCEKCGNQEVKVIREMGSGDREEIKKGDQGG